MAEEEEQENDHGLTSFFDLSVRPASGPTPSPIGRLEDDTAEPLDDPHAALRLPHQDAPASPAHEHELADLSSAPFDVPTPAPNHALSLYSGRSGHGSSSALSNLQQQHDATSNSLEQRMGMFHKNSGVVTTEEAAVWDGDFEQSHYDSIMAPIGMGGEERSEPSQVEHGFNECTGISREMHPMDTSEAAALGSPADTGAHNAGDARTEATGHPVMAQAQVLPVDAERADAKLQAPEEHVTRLKTRIERLGKRTREQMRTSLARLAANFPHRSAGTVRSTVAKQSDANGAAHYDTGPANGDGEEAAIQQERTDGTEEHRPSERENVLDMVVSSLLFSAWPRHHAEYDEVQQHRSDATSTHDQ